MREPIVINAETREITVPETERAFGVAGERKVEVKHIRIEGRTVDGTDLTQGFTWKVSCENAGKELCADLIDGIVADAGNIEFDWIVGAAPMAYKGTMHFAVCAVRVDAAGNILQEWHSKLGAGDVANGIEATVQNIGGQDLLAHIQSITAAAQQNAAAAQRDAAAAAKSAEDAATSEGNAAASAKKAQTLVDGMPSDYSQAMKDIGTLKNQMQRAYPDDSTIGENPWSSKNIVDMLCPPLEESGNPVVCYPVAGYPLGVKASWEPVQEGSGDPSPENIRPIKGRDSVTITRQEDNQVIALTLPETVYGGEVDAVSGEGQETWKTLTLDGKTNKFAGGNTYWNLPHNSAVGVGDWYIDNIYSSHFPSIFGGNASLDFIYTTKAAMTKYFQNADALNDYLAAQYAAGTPVQLCYKLATPTPFTATGAQPIPALAGVNTVLTDADSATVTGRADTIKRITYLEDAVASQT